MHNSIAPAAMMPKHVHRKRQTHVRVQGKGSTRPLQNSQGLSRRTNAGGVGIEGILQKREDDTGREGGVGRGATGVWPRGGQVRSQAVQQPAACAA